MRIARAIAAQGQFNGPNKVLRFQTLTDSTPGSESQALGGFAEAFGDWFSYSLPELPQRKGSELVAACELMTIEEGDAPTVIASRDTRTAKYAQDLKAGEFCLVNGAGHRLFVGKLAVSLTAGGGFLTFDVTGKKVGLVGIPSKAGGAAPYLSIDTTSIGIVSATGASSVVVKDGQVTLSGSAVSLDAGAIYLGKGAADAVVTVSQLQAVIAALRIWAATLLIPAIPAGPVLPPVIPLVPGRRVFAAL